MKAELFYNKINQAIQAIDLTNTNASCRELISFFDEIIKDNNISVALKMTRMTILFEGFYRSAPDNSHFKKQLANIRLDRWSKHYGTPTIIFLLTYDSQIEQTCHLFKQINSSMLVTEKPWAIVEQKNLEMDLKNNVVVDKRSIDRVLMPIEDERAGQFLKTHNPSGGFTTAACDLYSQKFIEYADSVARNGGSTLEIGAAFGAASLQILKRGGKVVCNDIAPENLAVIRKRQQERLSNYQDSVTGDDAQLILIPGAFPDELRGLPENFFDAILICRVLHFFTGDQIEKSMEQLFTYLKPNGLLYVVCESPFLGNWWKSFKNEYEKRVSQGIKWPGEISNPVDYESSGRITSLPKFVHWITEEVLKRSLEQSKFEVKRLSYIDRRGQFPDDLLLDGRESVGAIASKPPQFC